MKTSFKKISAIMLSMVLVMVALAGCGSPKIDAAESSRILFNLYIKGDASEAEQLSLTKDEIQQVIDTIDSGMESTISSTFSTNGLTVSEEKVAEIVAARKAAMQNVTVTTEVVSSDSKSSEVKLTTTWFDEVALDTKAVEDALAEVQEMGLEDQQEALDKATELYVENLIAAYKALTFSEDTKEMTFKCTITENVWLPEDIASFAQNITSAVIGM